MMKPRQHWDFLDAVWESAKDVYEFEDYFQEWIVYDPLEYLRAKEAYPHYYEMVKSLGMSSYPKGPYGDPASFNSRFIKYIEAIGGKRVRVSINNNTSKETCKNISIKNNGKFRKLFDDNIIYSPGSRLKTTDYVKRWPQQPYHNRLIKWFKEKGVKKIKSNGLAYYKDYRFKDESDG